MKRLLLTLAILLTGWQSAWSKEIIKVALSGTLGASLVETAAGIDAWQTLKANRTPVEKPDLPYRSFVLSFTVDEHIGQDGQTVAVNEYRYIPSTLSSPGYLFLANVRGGWSSAVGSWFQLSDGADQALKLLIDYREP